MEQFLPAEPSVSSATFPCATVTHLACPIFHPASVGACSQSRQADGSQASGWPLTDAPTTPKRCCVLAWGVGCGRSLSCRSDLEPADQGLPASDFLSAKWS